MFSNPYTNRDYSYIIPILVIATRQEYLYTFYEETYAIDSKSDEHIELDFYFIGFLLYDLEIDNSNKHYLKLKLIIELQIKNILTADLFIM